MVKQIYRRLTVLEDRLEITDKSRPQTWADEVEAKIDRIMARPDSADFKMGMWGQVFDKDWRLID